MQQQAAKNANEKSTDTESMQWLNFIIKHWLVILKEFYNLWRKGVHETNNSIKVKESIQLT